jgi:pimeloyl-ACP methyl ester carboxylesterase
MPALVIAGSEDASASPASVKALADALPNARYIELAGAGHLAPLEQPDAFSEGMVSFLSEILSPSREAGNAATSAEPHNQKKA